MPNHQFVRDAYSFSAARFTQYATTGTLLLMVTLRLIILLPLCILSASCLSTAPKNDAEFAVIKNISALAGIYRNKGEVGDKTPPIYLSTILWPGKKLDHRAIETIRVKVASEKSLLVSAVSGGQIVREDEFVEGKDFRLISGQIQLVNAIKTSWAYPSGNPFIGILYDNSVLGLDEHGDGRLRSTGAMAGTAFLVIPVVIGSSENARFSRIRDQPE
jgi:hypothetical protein